MQQGFSCIKPALQNGAREAYMQSKINPQLIVIILPVSLLLFKFRGLR